MTRRRPEICAIAATLLCFAPFVARADAESDARLAAMEKRISQLEQKLEASEATIQKQEEMLKSQATPAVSAGSEPSSIDAFFKTVEVNGYVAASYMYQLNNPDNPIYANAANQFNLDHNTFNLDGVKIELTRPAANPGEAGFTVDLLFGDNGGILGGYRFNNGFPSNAGVYVQDMYLSYNWDDVLFKFGQWETLLGYEVIDSVLNKNITQGLLFTYAIPLVHNGLQASGKIGGGDSPFGWVAAVANGWNLPTDTNDNKGILAQLNYSEGPLTTAISTYWGADGNTGFSGQDVNTSNQAVVLDWTGTFVANDLLTFWSNIDWGIQRNVNFVSGPNAGKKLDATWYGIALGTQLTFNEKTYAAIRGEFFKDAQGYRILVGDNTSAYSLTTTLGYKLTQNLLTRAEFRYDAMTTDGPGAHDFFPQGGATSATDYQLLVQGVYTFD